MQHAPVLENRSARTLFRPMPPTADEGDYSEARAIVLTYLRKPGRYPNFLEYLDARGLAQADDRIVDRFLLHVQEQGFELVSAVREGGSVSAHEIRWWRNGQAVEDVPVVVSVKATIARLKSCAALAKVLMDQPSSPG
jgi:hypothetical protein